MPLNGVRHRLTHCLRSAEQSQMRQSGVCDVLQLQPPTPRHHRHCRSRAVRSDAARSRSPQCRALTSRGSALCSVCIECFTDTKAKSRGFVRQSLVEFISSQLKRGALPPNKIALIQQLTKLTEQKEVEEKRMVSSVPSASDPSVDAAARGGVLSAAAAEAAMNERDMMEAQKSYADLAKRHTEVDTELTDMRLKTGLVATVVFPGESSTINFWYASHCAAPA